MVLKFYWYPKCDTCRKAKKWLNENKVDYQEIHIVDEPPQKEELRNIIQKSGQPIRKFFNTSGKKYRELGLKDKLSSATDDEMLNWLVSDGMLIKRPILANDEKATVGFKEEEYEKVWK
ncbi:arsenate reductase family protein [Sediminibacillus albus]|uniref:Arsenate reductase n=1 Tax=Sediminibacillus albus TaxID=407036 RepID=A0A1G8YWC3_9BACI|nr:arsenate reductase family protein [Sediminibacillus albus]SDK07047.1 arsenate reductase [Sediminibacillus albus]